MKLILWLLAIHLLYDWHWQGDFVGVAKAKSDFILFIHSLTWAVLLTLVFAYFRPDVTNMQIIGLMMWFTGTHFLIDRWKARSKNVKAKWGWQLWVDQLLHLATIVIALWPN